MAVTATTPAPSSTAAQANEKFTAPQVVATAPAQGARTAHDAGQNNFYKHSGRMDDALRESVQKEQAQQTGTRRVAQANIPKSAEEKQLDKDLAALKASLEPSSATTSPATAAASPSINPDEAYKKAMDGDLKDKPRWVAYQALSKEQKLAVDIFLASQDRASEIAMLKGADPSSAAATGNAPANKPSAKPEIKPVEPEVAAPSLSEQALNNNLSNRERAEAYKKLGADEKTVVRSELAKNGRIHEVPAAAIDFVADPSTPMPARVLAMDLLGAKDKLEALVAINQNSGLNAAWDVADAFENNKKEGIDSRKKELKEKPDMPEDQKTAYKNEIGRLNNEISEFRGKVAKPLELKIGRDPTPNGGEWAGNVAGDLGKLGTDPVRGIKGLFGTARAGAKAAADKLKKGDKADPATTPEE